MTSPHNEWEVASTTTPVEFSGYIFEPNQTVDVQAMWPNDGNWYNFSRATSVSSPTATVWDSTLYRWGGSSLRIPSWAWKAGKRGHVAKVRSYLPKKDYVLNTFDMALSDVLECRDTTSGWTEFIEKCASKDNGTVTIQTKDFLPDGPLPRVTSGATDCSYAGDDACSACIDGAYEELSRPLLDIRDPAKDYRIRTGSAPAGSWNNGHVQGIARLSDIRNGSTRVGRMVLTSNLWGAGLVYAEQTVTSSRDSIYNGGKLQEKYELDITAERNHPSGAQAHGNVVAIAMEGGAAHASVDFYRFPPGKRGYLLNRLVLDGSRGEPDQRSGSGASAAGFVMLADGHYLVAIAGKNHGTRGIWFYRSFDPRLDNNTEWEYLSYWEPSCTNLDGDVIDPVCFGGAAGMALFTDCSGAVHMYTMNGSDTSLGDEYQWSQLYRLSQNRSGVVVPVHQYTQRDNTGKFQTNSKAFRWSGGFYVSEAGLPVVFNTERRTNEDDNDEVDGHLHFREPPGSGFPGPRPREADGCYSGQQCCGFVSSGVCDTCVADSLPTCP